LAGTSSHCFICQLPAVKLLKMSAHCANTDTDTLFSFIDSIINNVLLHQSFLEFINISELRLLETLLHDSQTL